MEKERKILKFSFYVSLVIFFYEMIWFFRGSELAFVVGIQSGIIAYLCYYLNKK